MILVCIMEKYESVDGGRKNITTESKTYFNTEIYINLESTYVKDILSKMIKEILEKISIFQRNGPGWYFKEVSSLEIHIVDYKPIKGSSYIPLPDFIMKKKSIINIQNEDNKCFLWSILRYLHPVQMNEVRLTDIRKYENDLNFKGVDFPVKLKDITEFENQNPDLPGINVFSVNDNNKIYPLRLNQKDLQKTIDLFLFSKDEKQHYSLIKNFSRLARSQITSDMRKIHICKKCLTHFTKLDLFVKHITYCSHNETVAVKMPTKKTILNFQNHYKKLPIPFVVYADFECFTKPINSCQPNPNSSFTHEYQKHEPSGYCLYLKGLDGIKDNYKPIVYTKKSEEDNISEKFIKHLKILTHSLYRKYYLNQKPLKLTPEEEKDFKSAKVCHICEQELLVYEKTGEIFKVRDHCHFTGKYRGAAHNECNLKCRKPLILPVVFHNLQGYDSHLFIKQLAKVSGDLSCIPSTEDKYISFSQKIKVCEYFSRKKETTLPIKFEIRFIDSFKFLQTSLANLVSNLQPTDFKNLNRVIKEKTSLLTRKGCYPYDYVSSIDILQETKLPLEDLFYSKLYDEHISDEDYQHAIKVYKNFNCKTLRDYHDLYLKSDVLLLSDVFENFRKTCLKHYKLDPCHYYTAPGLAWDACLKETNQNLELLKDYDMLMMFERGIRGGITHISKRYAEANNKYMKDYNQNEPSSYIQYLDANNLCLKNFLLMVSNGLIITKPKYYNYWKKEIQIKVTYLKSIWNIQKSYGNHIMIILLHPKK